MARLRAYTIALLILMGTASAVVAICTPYVNEVVDWAVWHYVKWQRGHDPLPANYQPPAGKKRTD